MAIRSRAELEAKLVSGARDERGPLERVACKLGRQIRILASRARHLDALAAGPLGARAKLSLIASNLARRVAPDAPQVRGRPPDGRPSSRFGDRSSCPGRGAANHLSRTDLPACLHWRPLKRAANIGDNRTLARRHLGAPNALIWNQAPQLICARERASKRPGREQAIGRRKIAPLKESRRRHLVGGACRSRPRAGAEPLRRDF